MEPALARGEIRSTPPASATPPPQRPPAPPPPTSIGPWLNNIAGDPKGKIIGEFNDIRGDVADKLAEKLGIHQ
ncbi:hypothetical protein VC83_01989 [Pseudogymnoascus destructans]|uniref:Uncharacterized protein n=1 Tax=Pseudogymnoascus destructans TaxID=655981 RepID=A0A177AHY9_9PEZI|nr:uncharacterized protein VC83_01989 [Pseudogymnoascus destructans]OAF61678.1 hypothetical protein VC83_01989 [Pseudogymnoascus destructans]